MPALLTRMSGTPCSAMSAATPSRTAAASVTSKETTAGTAPSAATWSLARTSASGSRPCRMTRAPCWASPVASARPRPRAEPVMSARRPVMSNSVVISPLEDREHGPGEQEADDGLERLLGGPHLERGLDVHSHEASHEPEAGVVDVAGEHRAGGGGEGDRHDLHLGEAAGAHGGLHEAGRGDECDCRRALGHTQHDRDQPDGDDDRDADRSEEHTS